MSDIPWERYPQLAADPLARRWLLIQANLGLAANTLAAYGRSLDAFLAFSQRMAVVPATATKAHIAAYVHEMAVGPPAVGPQHCHAGLANATMQLRLTALRLFYDYLLEEGLRADNPVGRGRYTPGNRFAGARDHGLIPHYQRLPWIPSDAEWQSLLQAAQPEWAGLNLTAADLQTPGVGTAAADRGTWYPLELIRAVVMVWVFAGLRSDEIQRLRVGCIRWQLDAGAPSGTDGEVPNAPVCLLDVPVNKTGAAFTKPVDRVVGEAIAAWERVRPPQPASLDPKTAEHVQYLFAYRGRRMGKAYINTTVIPMLCKRAGVPEADARGPITSHRARSTIASHLFNAREPMSLVELQHWLGHRSPSATQHYAKITPTRLAKAYQDADYFGRNIRTIEVLINQTAVLNGEAARGLPWKYYDLGHGYCTYDFFEHCEHRMACAQCGFYRPKPGFLALLREKQAHLLHMQQDIPLTDIELAVVAGDLAATEQLIAQLSDVATPAGPTPRQLHTFGQDGATPVMQRQADGRGSSKERRGEGGEGGAGEGVGA